MQNEQLTEGNFPATAKIIRAISINPRPFQYYKKDFIDTNSLSLLSPLIQSLIVDMFQLFHRLK
jgi:hypothetical protein